MAHDGDAERVVELYEDEAGRMYMTVGHVSFAVPQDSHWVFLVDAIDFRRGGDCWDTWPFSAIPKGANFIASYDGREVSVERTPEGTARAGSAGIRYLTGEFISPYQPEEIQRQANGGE